MGNSQPSGLGRKIPLVGKGRFDCLSLLEPLLTVVIFVCQFAPAGFSLNVCGQLTVQGLVLVFEKPARPPPMRLGVALVPSNDFNMCLHVLVGPQVGL